MANMPKIVRVKYEVIGVTKMKKQLIQLQKLFDRCVASGKRAGLTKSEIADMIKIKVKE